MRHCNCSVQGLNAFQRLKQILHQQPHPETIGWIRFEISFFIERFGFFVYGVNDYSTYWNLFRYERGMAQRSSQKAWTESMTLIFGIDCQPRYQKYRYGMFGQALRNTLWG